MSGPSGAPGALSTASTLHFMARMLGLGLDRESGHDAVIRTLRVPDRELGVDFQ